MANAFRRKDNNGKPAKKWTGWYYDADGKKRQFTGTSDKASTVQIAQRRETEARLVREGLIDRREVTTRDASRLPLCRHIEDYRLDVLAKGATEKHCWHIHGVLTRLFVDASITSIGDLNAERIQAALARMREKHVGKQKEKISTRTVNHAIKTLRAFTKFLKRSDRISEIPQNITAIDLYPKEIGVKRTRRALTRDEANHLLVTTESAPDYTTHWASRHGQPTHALTGPQRAMLYRVALGTGFRASEVASLTPLSFRLVDDKPVIRLEASAAKNDKGVDQPIRKDLAERLAVYLNDLDPKSPVWKLPPNTALMLKRDLEAAGITPKADDGVVDFHSLRVTFITLLILSGVNVKIVQKLARHSDVRLTLEVYTRIKGDDLRDGLEMLP